MKKVIVVYLVDNKKEEDEFSYNEHSLNTDGRFIEFTGINGGTDRKWYNSSLIYYMYFYESELK